MARDERVLTAIGQPFTLGRDLDDVDVRIGLPPVILQVQPYAYIPIERPEHLRQFEEDLRAFYGIAAETSGLAVRGCETCSCCSTDDCGFME